jgi:Lycopene cyclase
MSYQYVWLIWASAFMLPWGALYLANRQHRAVMWRASLGTMPLGLTEPLFVPEYWNPPSVFDLAARTGFDIESLIFCFAIGGIGAVAYNTITRQKLVTVPAQEKAQHVHRFHGLALITPYALFVPLYVLPWNPIYPAMVCLVVGAVASILCRPDLMRKTLLGGGLFLAIYTVFIFGLEFIAPGYIESVWNLPALSGLVVWGIPAEELMFGFAFGMYWTGIYEHFTWRRSVSTAR